MKWFQQIFFTYMIIMSTLVVGAQNNPSPTPSMNTPSTTPRTPSTPGSSRSQTTNQIEFSQEESQKYRKQLREEIRFRGAQQVLDSTVSKTIDELLEPKS